MTGRTIKGERGRRKKLGIRSVNWNLGTELPVQACSHQELSRAPRDEAQMQDVYLKEAGVEANGLEVQLSLVHGPAIRELDALSR